MRDPTDRLAASDGVGGSGLSESLEGVRFMKLWKEGTVSSRPLNEDDNEPEPGNCGRCSGVRDRGSDELEEGAALRLGGCLSFPGESGGMLQPGVGW